MADTKERPILMSAEMVRAILDGRKTQTRRVIKPQPAVDERLDVLAMRDGVPNMWIARPQGEIALREGAKALTCPYGEAGDRLWVRETWQADPIIDDTWASTAWHGCKDSRIADLPERFHHPRFCNYRADWLHGDILWRPSIFMPRWASRITLEVVSVRVERLHDISEADALAEGVWTGSEESLAAGRRGVILAHRGAYASLWDRINGPGTWALNPWVWMVEFRRLGAGHDALATDRRRGMVTSSASLTAG